MQGYGQPDPNSFGTQGMIQWPQGGMQTQMPMGQSMGSMGRQLDPQLVQAILQMQMQGPKQNAIQRQMKTADMLRADASGQLAGRNTGRLQASPGIANLAANIYGNYQANQMTNAAGKEETKLAKKRMAASGKYFDALTGQKGSSLMDEEE